MGALEISSFRSSIHVLPRPKLIVKLTA